MTLYLPESLPESDLDRMLETTDPDQTLDFSGDVAVIVVDMTREFVEDDSVLGHSDIAEPVIRNINTLKEQAARSGVRSYLSRSIKGNHPLERGMWNETATLGYQDRSMTEISDKINISDGDIDFFKYKPSLFFGTQLHSMLNYDGVDTLIISGMTTSGCVRATVVDAFSHNYKVVIPIGCVGDKSTFSHEASLFDMSMKYADVAPLDDVLRAMES